MRHSSVINGKVVDWYYKKNEVQDCTNFYIGEQFIGQIFKDGKDYHAVSWVNAGNKVHGFRTRANATCWLAELYLKDLNKVKEK